MNNASPGKIARESASVRESAEHIKESASAALRNADLTTTLAADRTVLASERTYSAWVRTGLAFLASGIGLNALLMNVLPNLLVRLTASLMIVFSGLCFLAAVWRVLMRGPVPPMPNIRPLPAPLMFALNGVLIAIDIAALFGVWMA